MKPDLQQVFGYSESDLSDLRKGYLSLSLHKHWQVHTRVLAIQLPILIFVISVEIYAFLTGFFLGIVMAVFTILVAIWIARDIQRIRCDLRTGQVKILNDRFRTIGKYSGPSYLVDTYGHRYRITQLQHFRLTGVFGQVEGDCIVYYFPRSRRVVAVEC